MKTGIIREAIYSHQDLQKVLSPRTVAVVGASPNTKSFGGRTLTNLQNFEGTVYPINPKYDEILGLRAYRSISDLPEVPDCVVLAVPKNGVEEIVAEAAALGVGGAILYSSGYAETGRDEDVLLQERLQNLSLESGMRILGPNCMGIVNFSSQAALTFAERLQPSGTRQAAVGLVSQSGALAFSLAQAAAAGVSISHILMAGNSCDVDVADLIAYLTEEPECKAIACVLEGISKPRRLIEAANLAWKAGKPLVIFKLATGERGAAAAMSHTGSLAGSHSAFQAALTNTGAILVDDFETLIETASFFAKAPLAATSGIAALSTSGGAAILAADKAERHQLLMPAAESETIARLKAVLPDFASTSNPFDVTAQTANSVETLDACCRALLSDENFGCLVVGFTSATDSSPSRIAVYEKVAQDCKKPVCVVWLSQWQLGPGAEEAASSASVALFRSMDHCMSAIAAWQRYSTKRSEGNTHHERISDRSAGRKARGVLEAAPEIVLDENTSRQIVGHYGIPVVSNQLVHSPGEAAEAAARIGYPLVLKVVSSRIPHKSEIGAVALNVSSETELLSEYNRIMGNARKVALEREIDGVLVQPMVPAGIEVMVGAKNDAQFGPMVVVGLGGILVELLNDVVIDTAPVDRERALGMLSRMRGHRLLQGFRGLPAVDELVLAEIICRVSELAADHADLISEVDINPLICNGNRVLAVDALIALTKQKGERII